MARKGGRGSLAGEPVDDAMQWPLASGAPGLDALGGPDPFRVPVRSFTACTHPRVHRWTAIVADA